jgi:GNAT superfamily N-acetyltransferase
MEGTVRATVRLATRADAPAIAKLIQELAEFEELSHACLVTEEKVLASLWKLPPFQGPTVFMLEVGQVEEGSGAVEGVEAEEEAAFQPVVRNVVLKKPIDDPAKEAFKSSYVAARTVIGFVLFFPNFSTFLAQGGYYIEDLYVRKPFRGGGFGTILLKSVVQQAKKLGAGRVEWCVLDWNVNAIKFYEGLGAVVMPEWRICRLTGDALQSCAL